MDLLINMSFVRVRHLVLGHFPSILVTPSSLRSTCLSWSASTIKPRLRRGCCLGLFSIVIIEVFTSPVQGKPGLPRMERPADDTLMIPATKLRLPLEITIASALASENTLTSADARFHRGPYPYGDRNLLAGPPERLSTLRHCVGVHLDSPVTGEGQRPQGRRWPELGDESPRPRRCRS